MQEKEQQETEHNTVLEWSQDVDRVEEEGEGPENSFEVLLEDDEDAIEDASDPFEARFANPDDNRLSRRLKALAKNHWTVQKTALSQVGKAMISTLGDTEVGELVLHAAVSGPADLKLKQKLASSFAKHSSTFNPLEQALAPFLFNYQDILFCGRRPVHADCLRRLMCIHAVNHVFK